MTEAEWLAATDWRKLRPNIRMRKGHPRKVRLFSVACCRRIAHPFHDARTDAALECCELFADGHATLARLGEVEEAANAAIAEAVEEHGANELAWARDAPWRAARRSSVADGAVSCLRALAPGTNGEAAVEELAAQTVLFRDIFGSPYRRKRCERSWLTSDVLALARGIYDEKAFDRMPILADALQDAGCNYDLVLNHCRDTNQVHVRGCWVVDLLLGKQ